MRYKLLLFPIILCCLLACHKQPFSQDVHGKPISNAEIANKWMVLNYWATWCQSCYAEFPELNQFYQTHHNKDVLVFGVNYDGLPNKELLAFVTKNKINYPILTSNPGFRYGIGDIAVLPATYIISPQGVLYKQLLGKQTAADLENVIATAIKSAS